MEFTYKRLDLSHLNELLELSSRIYNQMPRKEFWGGISKDEFIINLTFPNYILGAFYNTRLVAFMNCYYPSANDFKHYEIFDAIPSNYIFLHGVMVDPDFRGNSLQYILGKKIIEENPNKSILATVHPDNIASKKNIERLGLKILKTMDVGYGYRHVMILEK